MTLLSLDSVSVSFGGVKAVADVSLALAAGEIRGLIGPNGAGKTSLINAITGIVRAQAGRITIGGHNLLGLAPDAICKLGVARTFQHVELFRDATVLANVMTGLYRHQSYGVLAAALRLPGAQQEEGQALEEAHALLAAFDLTPLTHEIAGSLPFGIQKRIDMARALAARPSLLLLDEPVSGMSESEADAAITTARSLARDRGITLLVVEHNMRVMMRLAERITVMHQGRVIAEGTPEQIRANAAVVDAYLGTEQADA
jgi:branched-chain amino acid transport system ATP-binding protein